MLVCGLPIRRWNFPSAQTEVRFNRCSNECLPGFGTVAPAIKSVVTYLLCSSELASMISRPGMIKHRLGLPHGLDRSHNARCRILKSDWSIPDSPFHDAAPPEAGTVSSQNGSGPAPLPAGLVNRVFSLFHPAGPEGPVRLDATGDGLIKCSSAAARRDRRRYDPVKLRRFKRHGAEFDLCKD